MISTTKNNNAPSLPSSYRKIWWTNKSYPLECISQRKLDCGETCAAGKTISSSWLDTAAREGHKSQNAEISPAFNIKLTQGSALAPFSSTLTQRTDMGHTRGRCHETPLGISYRMKLSRAAGFTTLHNDTHLQPGILHYAKLPQDTIKYSLDYNSL